MGVYCRLWSLREFRIAHQIYGHQRPTRIVRTTTLRTTSAPVASPTYMGARMGPMLAPRNTRMTAKNKKPRGGFIHLGGVDDEDVRGVGTRRGESGAEHSLSAVLVGEDDDVAGLWFGGLAVFVYVGGEEGKA